MPLPDWAKGHVVVPTPPTPHGCPDGVGTTTGQVVCESSGADGRTGFQGRNRGVWMKVIGGVLGGGASRVSEGIRLVL